MNRDLLELRNNDIAMECFHEIAMDLPAIERSRYVSIVTESIVNNPNTQLKIISKLAKQVDSLQQIDLDQCRKSMGNITKYPYYDAMNQAIEIINESEITSDIPNVIRMNKLHNILLDNAPDFIWGFKHNDMVMTKTYVLLTRLLFIMIDLSISDYIKKLEINFKFNTRLDRTPVKISRIINDTDKMIRLFEKGDWRMICNSAKKAALNRNMKALDEMESTEASTEAINFTLPSSINDAITKGWGWASGLKTSGKVVIGIVIILLCYRNIAFFIAHMGGKFANCVRHWAELIKAHDVANRNQSDSAVEKHNKVYNLLIGMADRIEAFFDKASRETEADIKEANKQDFNTNEITQIDSIDFGF